MLALLTPLYQVLSLTTLNPVCAARRPHGLKLREVTISIQMPQDLNRAVSSNANACSPLRLLVPHSGPAHCLHCLSSLAS